MKAGDFGKVAVLMGGRSAEEIFLAIGGHAREKDHLVAAHMSFIGNLAPFDHIVDGVVFHPCHKEDFLVGQFCEPIVIVVAAVHH